MGTQDDISSYMDICRGLCRNHHLIACTLTEDVVGMKLVTNFRLEMQFKTTVDALTLASVLKQIKYYEAQNMLTSSMMAGGKLVGKCGYAAVKAHGLLLIPDHSEATELF